MDSRAPSTRSSLSSSSSSSRSQSFSTAPFGGRRTYPKSSYPIVLPPESISNDPDPDPSPPDSFGQLLWPTGRMPYYSDSGLFLGTISARMRSRPAFPTSHRTQRRYAQAILTSMPVDSRDPEWATGVEGAAGGLWECGGGNLFPEEVSMQLRQHSERKMFSYLARLYENALDSPKRAEQIVRRGGEILAAVRLLAGLPHHHHSPAGGTEARNPSQVSVWGWKPYREIALAERVMERRRLRAAEARAKAREKKTLGKRGPPPMWKPRNGSDASVSSITQTVSFDTAGETRARMQMTWAEKELMSSRKRRAKSRERLWKELPVNEESNLYGGDAGYSSRDTQPPLWAITHPYQREAIHWNYPDYDDGYNIPALNLPSPLEDGYTITTATVASGDRFLRSHTIKEATETISLPYSHRRPPSEPVSPKTTPSSSAPSHNTYKPSKVPSSAYITTDSEQLLRITEPIEAVRSPETYHTTSSTDSFGPGSLRLRRFRSAFKNAFPSVPRLPWSSGSQTSNSISEGNSEVPSRSTSRRLRGARTPWMSRRNAIRSTKLAAEPNNPVSEIALHSNRTTTTERVGRPASVVNMTGGEVLTRTEREYQEVLSALQDLKREMKLERETMRNERRRSKSRGRRIERRARSRSASRDTARASKETVRWWLGDVPLGDVL